MHIYIIIVVGFTKNKSIATIEKSNENIVAVRNKIRRMRKFF